MSSEKNELPNGPQSGGWKELLPEKRLELFEKAVAGVSDGQLQGYKDKVDIRIDKDLSFASINRAAAVTNINETLVSSSLKEKKEGKLSPLGHPRRQITRTHFTPNSEATGLAVSSQADFYYDILDEKSVEDFEAKRETDFPDYRFPSVVRISRRGESTGLLGENIDSWQETYTPDPDRKIMPGTDVLDEERAELHPLFAFHTKIPFFGSSLIDIIRDGQHFSVRFRPESGKLLGIMVEDYEGKNKSGQVIAGEGIRLSTGTGIKPGLLVNVMDGEVVRAGSFSAHKDLETGKIIIGRYFDNEETVILEIPSELNETEGIKRLFDFDSIERPFEAPKGDDLFTNTSLGEAFDVQFTPRSLRSENVLNQSIEELNKEQSEN